jgi:hypothetical protein
MMLKEKLENKNILFFSVQTFNLEKEILNKLKEFGANVDYYDERPSNNNFVKGIIRLRRSVYQHRIDKYYNQILEKVLHKTYDFLFVNRGEVIPEFFLEKFKVIQPNCVLIFYTWDSFTNHTHPVSILKFFDKKFTFDSDDAVKYNINFRPLFYLDAYKNIRQYLNETLKYDLLFLGTAHSDRYKISTKIASWCNQEGLTSFCYYYMHGRLVYYYKKMFDKSFEEFDVNKLSFKSLNTNDIITLYKKSNVILDINHPGQKGLTMRTFESVGSAKKMITTNSEIIKYSFYNPKNILVIDRDEIEIDKTFFETKYEDLDDETYERASIEGWLKCLFVTGEPNIWIKEIN